MDEKQNSNINLIEKYKFPISLSVIILLYGLLRVIIKSYATFDWSVNGLNYFFDEMEKYFGAIGATCIIYVLSTDRAKKEIKEDLEKEKSEDVKLITKSLVNDAYEFIHSFMEIISSTNNEDKILMYRTHNTNMSYTRKISKQNPDAKILGIFSNEAQGTLIKIKDIVKKYNDTLPVYAKLPEISIHSEESDEILEFED